MGRSGMWGRRQTILSASQAVAWLHVARAAEQGPLGSRTFPEGIAEIRSRYGLGSIWFRVEQPGRPPVDIALGGAATGTPVAIGSISKSVTGIGIALLIQNRKIGLDSNLKDLLSGYFYQHHQNLDASLYPITIRRLLTHTAGLRPNYTSDPVNGIHNEIVMPMVRNKNHFFDYLMAADAARSDGRNIYIYSNISYLMLGLVIESITGQPYAYFCQNEIFHKLNISSAIILPHWDVIAPFSGWSLNLADLLRVWSVFDIYHPTLLSRQTLTDILLGRIASPIRDRRDIYYALGTYTRQNVNATSYVLSHDGVSNFSGLEPTYFMLIQKTVPGSAWAFATTPNQPEGTRKAIQQALVDLAERAST
jgi:D-alanyl-D-alanine carboxypeptidase